jgi:hypothetical protein
MPVQYVKLKDYELSRLKFKTDQALPPYEAGQMAFDPDTKVMINDTLYQDNRLNDGQEIIARGYNNTGVLIPNGTPVSAVSGGVVGGITSIKEADPDLLEDRIGYIGITTADIADGADGPVTTYGVVRGVNTVALGLILGPIWGKSGGGFTQIPPTYPTNRILYGSVIQLGTTDGELAVATQFLDRPSVSIFANFTSQGQGAGTFYVGSNYEWAATSVTLNQASPSQTFGTAGEAKAGHPGVVPQVAGTVDTGQVGLRVIGTLDQQNGPQLAAQTAIITDDITTLTANELAEAVEHMSGDLLFELYVVSGSPTTYSLTCNYGTSKYVDAQDTTATLVGFDATWIGGANDTAANVTLIKHEVQNWTYAAAGFIPGGSIIATRLVDQAIDGNVANGKNGAWKRTNINEVLSSVVHEGIVMRVDTTQPNTFQNLSVNIFAASEGLL